jgi:undecaprenyl-diphosphatase
VPDWLDAIILGVIEGVTEFLPISSTGHLLLAEHWLGHRSDFFNVGIQSGAVLAVLVVFANRIRQLLVEWRDPVIRDYLLKLGAAFGLTAVGGLGLKKLGLELPETPVPVAWATLIGGVLFLVVERWLRGRGLTDEVSWLAAVCVGVGQLLAAVFPGASRSGSTILMALVLGVNRKAATEFSFLLGVPTLLAAGGLQFVSSLGATAEETIHWGDFGLGLVFSAVTAFVAVRWLLRFVQTHTFEVFGYYRIVLGVAILLAVGRG